MGGLVSCFNETGNQKQIHSRSMLSERKHQLVLLSCSRYSCSLASSIHQRLHTKSIIHIISPASLICTSFQTTSKYHNIDEPLARPINSLIHNCNTLAAVKSIFKPSFQVRNLGRTSSISNDTDRKNSK